MRFTRFHRLGGKPHAAIAPALAQSLAGLFIHGNGNGCVADLGDGLGFGMAGEQWCQTRLIAEGEQPYAGVARGHDFQRRHHHFGPRIAAHGVDGYRQSVRHA